MAKELGRENEVEEIAIQVEELKEFINQYMWDEEESYYFDRYRDGSLSDLKSIASYWALVSGVVPQERLESFVSHLSDTSMFARVHRVPTLSADSKHFSPDGDYWNGSIWAPTNYMVLKGLTHYQQDSLAFEIAKNHLQNVTQVFEETGEIHENYAPDKVQGNDKKDFVGWTGLVPINVMFEYVFGLRPNVPEQTLILDVRLTDSYGVKNYPFGKDGLLDIEVSKRKNTKKRPKVKISSNIQLLIVVRWEGGEYIITPNSCLIPFKEN
jgi:glycogen debranching enzyme